MPPMTSRLPGLLLPAILSACAAQAGRDFPPQVTLKNVDYAPQTLNNCGPVNAMIVANYYGQHLTQVQTAQALKDSRWDVEVSTEELAAYFRTFGLNTVIRYAGDGNVIRALLAQDIPVIVQQRLKEGDDTAHFRTVYAYSPESFTSRDPLRGAELQLSNTEFAQLWNYYNGEYLVAYPPEREADVQAALGKDWDQKANWQRLLRESGRQARKTPDDAFAWWGVGAAQLALGRVEDAARAFDRAVEAGVPLQYYWYRQEAFEAWNQAGQPEKTLALTGRILAQQPGIKEVLAAQAAAARLAGS